MLVRFPASAWVPAFAGTSRRVWANLAPDRRRVLGHELHVVAAVPAVGAEVAGQVQRAAAIGEERRAERRAGVAKRDGFQASAALHRDRDAEVLLAGRI